MQWKITQVCFLQTIRHSAWSYPKGIFTLYVIKISNLTNGTTPYNMKNVIYLPYPPKHRQEYNIIYVVSSSCVVL